MKHSNMAIAKASFQPEGSEVLTLEYTLLSVSGPEGETLYALRVDKRCPNGNLLEREETPGLTGSLEDATVMAKAFADGSVPPSVLLEVAEEWDPAFYAARVKSETCYSE